jgi:hypothetical protein
MLNLIGERGTSLLTLALMVVRLLAHIDCLDESIAERSAEVEQVIAPPISPSEPATSSEGGSGLNRPALRDPLCR